MHMRKIFFLLVLALALPLDGLSSGVDELCSAAGWVPGYNRKEKIDCNNEPLCHNHLMLLLNKNEKYVQKAKEACSKSQEAVNGLSNITQQSSFTNLQQIVLQGKASIENLQSQNAQLLKEIPADAMGNIAKAKELAKKQPKVLAHVKQIEQRYKGAKENNKYTAQIASEYPKIKQSGIAQPQARALDRNGDFIKSLLADKEKYAAAASELAAIETKLAQQSSNLGNPTPGSSGGGFDPLSLLPLAGPLLGLMNSPETPKSGLSSPNSSEPEPLPSTDLTDKTLPSTNLADSKHDDNKNPTSPDSSLPSATNPIYADAFTGADPKDDALPKLSSLSESSGKFGASNANGTGYSKGNEKAEEKRNPAATEEALQGINLSGGGAGFQANAGGAPSADGPMAELLQNMESSLENSSLPEQVQADAAALDPDALFVRVRACYMRAARKGLVLDSLRSSRIEETEGQL